MPCEYHSIAPAGKLAVTPTKPCRTQRDLSLAYTPGVAVPCLEIERDPTLAYKYMAKGNLVAVMTALPFLDWAISANLLKRTALPSMTGLPARAPILPNPRTAVPLLMTATRLPLAVYLYARVGSRSISRQGTATPGV